MLRFHTQELEMIVRQSAGYSGLRLPCFSGEDGTHFSCENARARLGFYLTQVYLTEKKVGIKLGMENAWSISLEASRRCSHPIPYAYLHCFPCQGSFFLSNRKTV